MSAVDGPVSYTDRLPTEHVTTYRNDQPVYTVLSYNTPIAWITRSGLVRIPDVKYSPTTTQHQWTVKAAWDQL